MQITAIADPGLGNTAYLVDLGDGSGLVVDPERDPRPYLEAAKRRRLKIKHVVETHLHADFVSGARELIAVGANLLAPAAANLAYPHTPVEDGTNVAVGDLQVTVIATPGHTPEHVAYLLNDGDRPLALFSGGTLMEGGVARTDLVSPALTVPLARSAYRSVRRLFDELPDEVELHPTHGAGSFCSAGPATETGARTMGSQRPHHPVLLASSEDEFVSSLIGGLGTFPPYFLTLRPVNQAGPAIYGVDLPTLKPLDIDSLDQVLADGGTIVDARSIAQFGKGYIPGSISNELRDQFGTWLGWVLKAQTPVVVVLDASQDERELVRQALNVGFENLSGRIDLDTWIAAGRALNSIDIVDAAHIDPTAPIFDVRQQNEYEAGHVKDAMHVELGALTLMPAEELLPAVVHCGHGQRAMTGASLLARAGVETLAVTTAGPEEIARYR